MAENGPAGETRNRLMFKRPAKYFANRFHDAQEDAWLAYRAGLDLVLDWGRRSGKSELEIEIMIEDVETSGYSSMYCAITQKQARDIIWPKLTRRLLNDQNWKPNSQRLTWTYKGGPDISLKGTDEGNDRLRVTQKDHCPRRKSILQEAGTS